MSNIISVSPAATAADSAANDNTVAHVFETMASMTNYFVSTWNTSAELRALKLDMLVVHYGWTTQTIDRFKIGFDDGGVVEHLRAKGFTDEEMVATGAFRVDAYGQLSSRFAGRIVFPYFDEAGQTVYFTARQTKLTQPWLKDGKDCTPKYVKTKVHKQGQDDGISPLVQNVVFSTHEKPRKQKVGIIAEGMPDAISAAQAGYPVRSPVTTQFKEADAAIIDDLIVGWETIVLIPDMESNESGIKGAVKTARKLLEKGRDIRIVCLPHEAIKAEAEARVEALRRRYITEGRTPTTAEIDQTANWKVDLNEFLAAPADAQAIVSRYGELKKWATPEDELLLAEAKTASARAVSALRAERQEALRVLVAAARAALDVMIERLPTEPTPADFGGCISEVTETIARIGNEAEREMWIDRLKNQIGGRLPVLRKMVADAEPNADGGAERENPVTAILAGMKFFRLRTGRVFTVVDGEALAVDGEEFTSWVANRCYETKKAIVGPTVIKDATRAVVGISSKLPLGTAPIRYAFDSFGGGMWIDLADGGGNYVHVTETKITLEKRSPIAFHRPSGTCPMPVPKLLGKVEGCTQVLGEFFDFLAIGAESRAGLFAVIMSSMRPMEQPTTGALTRYTVGVFNGEHGAGKSTRQMFVRRLIDPREPASMKMPDTVDDLTIYSENSAVVSLDNQSTLSETMSDALCRVSTGDGNVKRSLYSSRDLSIFRGSRPIFVNGITDVVTRDDLLDRAIVVHVEKPETKKTDDELELEFRELLPSVLGALLYCMQQALAGAGSTEIDRSIRMLQAAQWAAAAESAAGFNDGAIQTAYLAARAEAVALATDDPFVTAVLGLLPNVGAMWKGTMTDLTDALVEHVEQRDEVTGKPSKKLPRDFPATAAKMRTALKRKQPALRALGVVVERHEQRTNTSSKATILTLERRAPESKSIAAATAAEASLNDGDTGAHGFDPTFSV